VTPEERGRKVESYGNAYAELAEALQQFPPEMWHYRDEHGCWSIHEHILHIADSEANSYIRCRRLIAEPGETLMAYDENRWAVELDYHQRDTEDAIQLFHCLRQQNYALIKSLPESVWSNTAYHPENGNMTLDDWLDVYERHITEHVGYMQENYAAWVKERNKT
jgi:hypothetical protein